MANKITNGFFKFLGLEDTREAPEPSARERGDVKPIAPYGQRERGQERAYTQQEESRPALRRRMDEPPAEAPRVARRNEDLRVIGMPQNNMPQGGAPMRMVVYQPQSYDDTQRIIDELKAGRSIIINLENLKVDVAQRVLDFISGAVYALDGNVRKISRGIFLVAPSNVDISGNFINNLPANFRGTGYLNMPKKDN